VTMQQHLAFFYFLPQHSHEDPTTMWYQTQGIL
jgi:hypothetical protein